MVAVAIRESAKGSVFINDARDLFPIRPSLPTIHRWAMAGCRGIVLESWFLGGRRCTNTAAVDRFLSALNQNAGRSPAAVKDDLNRRATAASDALAALGS